MKRLLFLLALSSTLKTIGIIACWLFIALGITCAYLNHQRLYGQQFAAQEPKSRSFKYSLTGEDWLTVRRINDAKDKDLWHPSMTVVTSTYKPVVTKHGDTWEISFRSPNIQAPDLP